MQGQTINLHNLDFAQMFEAGGIFMYAVLLISVISSVIIIEKLFALRYRFSIDGRRLFNEVKKYLAANDDRRALEVCRQYPSVPLAHVLGAGVANKDRAIQEIESAMESEALYHIPRINERIALLPGLANASILIGLLATIVGLISAFSGAGAENLQGLSKEQILAQGIAMAMCTTAFALMVAIPTVVIAMYLNGRANSLIDDLEHYTSALKHVMQRMKSGTLSEEFKSETEKTALPADAQKVSI